MVKKTSVQRKYKRITDIETPRYTSLTSPKYRQELQTVIDAIYSYGHENPDEIFAIFDEFRKYKFRLTLRLAAKIAYSYALMKKIKSPTCLSIVFPVYNEKNRLHKNTDHPNGENFLRAKIKQLEKLFSLNPKLRWRLIIVDDGSTDGTGHIIKYILEREYPNYLKNQQIQVFFMKDALKERLPYLEGVRTVKDSGKGSSIMYGLDKARKTVTLKTNEKHILVYTDADLSVHLGQLGLALYKIVEEGCEALIGQRRLPSSVVRRPKFKSARGKLYIYLLKKLLPQFDELISDPQAPFKMMTEQAFKKIIKFMREPGFSFDVELLLLLKLSDISTCNMGIGFIDSAKESHTKSNNVHLRILKSIVDIRKRHLPRSPADSALEHFIKSLSNDDWLILTNNIPIKIRHSAAINLGKLNISVEELNSIIQKNK